MGKIETLEELKNSLLEKQTYIYGAGKVARIIAKYCLTEKIPIAGIIVSSLQNNPEEIFGIKVIQLEDISNKKELNILVAVFERTHNSIKKVLHNYDIENANYLSDELIYLIERDIVDCDIDQMQILEWLIRNYQKDRNKYYWHHEFERNVTRANWEGYYQRDDYKDKFLRLINGLDRESINTIIRIINRQQVYLNTDDHEIDLFTNTEKEELKKLEDDFWNLIIKISPNLYMYNGYYLSSNDFEPSVFYYKHGIEKVKNKQILTNGVFLDVGGYVGDSALILQELKPQKVVTFEAVPEHCELIKNNMILNNINNVVIENMALGNSSGTITMEVCGSSSNAIHREGIIASSEIQVELHTLDEYVMEKEIDNIRLIKVDIEGSEPYFLQGAKDTISKYRPVLLISMYHNAHDFFEIKPMIESWNLGYTFQVFKSLNGNLTNETMLIAEVVK